MTSPPDHPLLKRLPRGGAVMLTHKNGKLTGAAAEALHELMREHIAMMSPQDATPYRKVASFIEGGLSKNLAATCGNETMMERGKFNRLALHHLQQLERQHGRDSSIEIAEAPSANTHLPPPPPRPGTRSKS